VQEDEPRLKCPTCGDMILRSYGDHVKLRATLLKWSPEGFYAVCKGCKKDVRMDFEILKSIQTKFEYFVKK
jgi:hypothetical protein